MSSHSFNRVTTIVLALTLFLPPLLFAPFTPNYFLTPKLAYLAVVTLVLGAVLTYYILKNRELIYSNSSLRLPLSLFVLATTISLLTNFEARTESFYSLGLLFFIVATLSYFASFVTSVASHKFILNFFFASTSVLAIHSIFQLTLLHTVTSLPLYMQTQTFTPTGSLLTTLSLFAITLVSGLGSLKNHSSGQKIIRLTAVTLSLIAIIGYTALIATQNGLFPRLLPIQAGWSLTLDALKNPHNLLVGTGFANFSSHYTANKPLFLNTTSWWNILPTSVSSELLQLLIVGGLPLLLSLIFLLYRGLTSRAQSDDPTLLLLLLMTVLSLALTPGSLTLYTLLFIVLGLLTARPPHKSALTPSSVWVISLAILSLFGSAAFYLTSFFRAEVAINKASQALQKNDSETVYLNTLAASRLLPMMTYYRLSNAQVNLSLAAALSQQQDISDEQKETISRLVSQAISEAKIATSLKPSDSSTWANLGNIYANLLTVAEGADQFAISAYARAVTLDPGSAPLRTEFGSLLLTLAQKTEDSAKQSTYLTRAGAELVTALQLKSDYAQAAYALSKVRSLTGDTEGAIQILESLSKILESESPESNAIQQDLTNLRSKNATTSGQSQ